MIRPYNQILVHFSFGTSVTRVNKIIYRCGYPISYRRLPNRLTKRFSMLGPCFHTKIVKFLSYSGTFDVSPRNSRLPKADIFSICKKDIIAWKLFNILLIVEVIWRPYGE